MNLVSGMRVAAPRVLVIDGSQLRRGSLPGMMTRALQVGWLIAAIAGMAAAPVAAAEIASHRALYKMSLGRAGGESGVTAASGTMAYQWGESCDGWTVEQRYRMKIGYAESPDVSIASNFVTWEAKDGLRYRFNQKETRNGADEEEVKGEAKLDGPGQGGAATFELPKDK